MKIYARFLKRPLDLIGALVLLLPALPLMALAALAIRLDSPGNVLYRQTRIGRGGKPFRIYKLRTMTTRTHDADGRKLRDRERVTTAGRWIRKLSLDELPQLINIIKGDMSFIGPRPLVERYLPYYTPEEMHRHDVRPGVTGWAQVNGRSDLGWEERFAYDLEYVRDLSLLFDLKIAFLTVKRVLSGSGTSTVRPAGLVDFDKHREGKTWR